jgi:peptidoglycan/xylan/chitin deacetylase (PgdA/CDA1 family)
MPVFILTYHRLPAQTPRDPNFYDVSPADFSAHLDALRARGLVPLDPHEVPGGKPGYLLTFDDGTRDHFEVVLPALRARGERGIFFIPTAKIGAEGRLTLGEVRALADEGHVVGCHSHEHIRLDQLRADAVREQLTTALAQLREITGRETHWFAPPGGFSNETVRQVATELGLRTIRTMRWGRNETMRLDRLECIPLSRSLTTKRVGAILDGRGLAWLKALYLGKQMIKALVPMRAYEAARSASLRDGR